MSTKHVSIICIVTFFILTFLVVPISSKAERPDDPSSKAYIVIYMEIENVTQGKGVLPHPDEVQVVSISTGITQPHDPLTGSPSGALYHNAVNIVRSLDQISPLFPFMLATGQPLGYVIFRFYNVDAMGVYTNLYTITLNDATIVEHSFEESGLKVNVNNSGQMENANESVSFVYKEIIWTDELSGTSREISWGSP